MRKFTLLFLFVSLLFSLDSFAAKRYWIASSAAYWNNTANWSSSSGGAGGSSVPTSSDTAYFDGNGLGNDTLDANVNVKRISIAAGYTGTIIQGSYSVTIGSTGATLSGGTFSGGSGSIVTNGAFVISGTAFTSTSGTFTIKDNYTLSSGSFSNNSGSVLFTGSGARTHTGSTTFYNLEFNATANGTTVSIPSGTTFTTTNLTVSGTHQTTLTGTGIIDVKGNITVTNTYITYSSTVTVKITGSGAQHIYGFASGSGFYLPALTINKSADTLHLHDIIYFGGNFTYQNGVIDAGTSAIAFGGTSIITIAGTFTIYGLLFTGNFNNIYNISNSITVDNNLNLSYNNSTGFCALNGGTIHVKGNVSVNNTTNTSVYGGTPTVITIDGTGSQTLTGSTNPGAGRFPSITVNKSSGTLSLVNTISLHGNWIYTSGTVNLGSSAMYFVDTKTITGSLTFHEVTFSTGTHTISSGTTLTVDSTLTIAGGTINTGDIAATGDIVIGTVASGGGGTAVLTINGTTNQAVTGNATASNDRLPSVVINKPSGTLSFSNTITVDGDWTYTSGTTDFGTCTIAFYDTKTISGSLDFYNILFGGTSISTYTISSGTTLTANGSVETKGSSAITINTGTINAKGDIVINNSGTTGGGNATINITGNASQELRGSGAAGMGRLPYIIIDKSDSTLTLSGVISVTQDWTYIQGDVDPDNSSVAFFGSGNIDGQGTSNTMSFYTVSIAGTNTLTGDLDANDNLNISSSSTLSAGSYSVNVGGRWRNTDGTWTYGTSTVTFDGRDYDEVKHTVSGSAVTETFYNLAFNRAPTGSQTFNSPVVVNHNLTLTQGHVITSSSHYLELINDATLTGGSDTAYICGPVRKTGDDAFTFPLGDTTLTDSSAYHPLGMTAPSSTTDQFEARYYAVGQTVGDSLVDSLASVSAVEYWTFERKAGTSDVVTTLGWNKNSTSIEDLNVLRIASWDGVKWLDIDIDSISVNTRMGTFIPLLTPVFNSGLATLTFANKHASVPYALLKKKLDGGYYQARNGRLFFRFDEEYTDTDQKLHFNVYDDQHVLVTSDQLQPASIQPTVHYGDNRYQMNTLFCGFSPGGALDSGFYILEVINEKNEHWYLRFEQFYDINLVTCYEQPSED